MISHSILPPILQYYNMFVSSQQNIDNIPISLYVNYILRRTFNHFKVIVKQEYVIYKLAIILYTKKQEEMTY